MTQTKQPPTNPARFTLGTVSKTPAASFSAPNRFPLRDALVCLTSTKICSTDVHILKGAYSVARGLTIGHDPLGVIDKLGSACRLRRRARVIADAIAPSGYSYTCLCGKPLAERRRYQQLTEAFYVLSPHSIHRVTQSFELLTVEDAAANRPFIAALVISRVRCGLPAPRFFDCVRRLNRFTDQESWTCHGAEVIAVFAR